MIELEDDDDGLSDGPTVVRRPIYEAVQELDAEREPGAPSSVTIAAGRAQSYRDEGDSANAALWGEIHHYLMGLECVRADARSSFLKKAKPGTGSRRKSSGGTPKRRLQLSIKFTADADRISHLQAGQDHL